METVETYKNGVMDTEVNIGIDKKHREAIAEALSKVLADSYMLYLKTHNYHWNVTGELFHSLHKQFEQQYRELAEAVDVIAERIRALGHEAPGSFMEFQELTSMQESKEKPEAMQMVRQLAEANEQVLRTVREALEQAKKAADEATTDVLTQRLRTHSKTAWMLRSHLE